MKALTTNSDFGELNKPHFAVILLKTITIPGDERSRTNPGHGYPESKESILEYLAFESEAELISWIERVTVNYPYQMYKVIKAVPVKVSQNVKIYVES